MCVSPVLIPNPNYHNRTKLIKQTADTECQYIRVPCNVCSECLAARQSALVQRSRAMSMDHYIFFCTLTYNSQSLPHIVCSNGVSISYVDISDLQKMFKRIRFANSFGRSFSYFFVSERGSQKGRPHVHGLIFIPKCKEDDKLYPAQLECIVRNTIFSEWKRNYGSDKFPIWKPLFTYRTKYSCGKRYSNFDCHYVVPFATEKGEEDVAFYVTKYCLKPSDYESRIQSALRLNLPSDEYEEVWNIVRSRCLCSKGFGAATDLQKDYVRYCVNRSSSDPDGLKFFAKDGSSSPLSRYYRRFISSDDAIRSVAARGGPISYDDRAQDMKERSIENGKRIVSEIARRDNSVLIFEDD